ncbi:hypothetical protein ACFWWT_04230 [Streptomyces sp. NPDC058676]|uniref:hypothetical protein n=1 Tax=Streptomyces sp. NPDC058676 TaxID=3346593 RepID=UPI0036684BE8
MPLKLFRRNQEPEPVRPGLARVLSSDSTSSGMSVPIPNPLSQLADALQDTKDEAARWKRHSDTFADERDTAVQAFDAKVLEVKDRTKERDGAYRERAQLLAWIAALHPSTAVITESPDVDEDGWQLLYLVAGGWQMSWHIHPRDAELFQHVTVVDVTDPRAQWDGHGTEQKYGRIRSHVRLLSLERLGADGSSTGVTEVRSA